MEKRDIILIDCYSENFIHKTTKEHLQDTGIILSFGFRKYKSDNSYILSIKLDVSKVLNFHYAAVTCVTEFAFTYEDFIAAEFYIKELELIIELVRCAYDNARIMFHNEYKNISQLNRFYLPFKFQLEIKELMAKMDAYNKL